MHMKQVLQQYTLCIMAHNESFVSVPAITLQAVFWLQDRRWVPYIPVLSPEVAAPAPQERRFSQCSISAAALQPAWCVKP